MTIDVCKVTAPAKTGSATVTLECNNVKVTSMCDEPGLSKNLF